MNAPIATINIEITNIDFSFQAIGLNPVTQIKLLGGKNAPDRFVHL
jgi:hypothetical protein